MTIVYVDIVMSNQRLLQVGMTCYERAQDLAAFKNALLLKGDDVKDDNNASNLLLKQGSLE